jgi:hypothetical protein
MPGSIWAKAVILICADGMAAAETTALPLGRNGGSVNLPRRAG